MKNFTLLIFSFSFLLAASLTAQNSGSVRGNVFDKDTGEPIIFGTIRLEGTSLGTITDADGFFSLGGIPVGNYTLVASYVGFDSLAVEVDVAAKRIVYERLYLSPSSINLGVVNISARKEKARSDVQISKITVTSEQIKSLPGTGGQTDVAQYLTVLPGIVSTGDQGGQIYIRGGSPIQNKILLDGMTIYNPFHSIGFFSVFETEIIRTMDVLTGGFNSEYGGRISAIIDIKTREGNKKRLSGLVAANPFQAKILLEGPIKKMTEEGGSTSFILTGKHSYIDETSPHLYSYAVDNDSLGLPYKFTDLYGKLSFVTSNGSKLNLFGFSFSDNVNFDVANVDWNAFGGGTNFTLIPPNSNLIIGGTLAFSDYKINMIQADNKPRNSSITTFNALLNFTYYGLHNEVKYGFELNGLNTDFRFKNFLDNTIQQEDFTTEMAGFIKYKQKLGNWIIEPSIRFQFYASQSESSIEPRIAAKWNVTDNFRLKLAGGLYSQNLISSIDDREVVNLFVGFLSGPEERIKNPGKDNGFASNRLQKAVQGVFGVEVDLLDNLELNVEPYIKHFTQLIQINRNKLESTDPNFVTEDGDAYGVDISLRYQTNNLYLWATYSISRVERDDGFQTFPTIFDRRHNINFLATYNFGQNHLWEAALRWNLGSGFPFTLTQGFYENFDFKDGISTDVLTGNGDLGVVFDDKRNGGRLPYFHRLDVSLKRTIKLSKYASIEAVASATNLYDRDNIFFFDRVRFKRVNQLPILPSFGVTFKF